MGITIQNLVTVSQTVLDWFEDAQNGSRRGRSCEDQIFSLVSQIRSGIGNSGNVYCCYIDFQKAFDFLDRDLLFLKLLRAGVDGKFYWALKNTLSSTSSCVRLNQRVSDSFATRFGTRQGDPISPTNFSIFINDLLIELRNNKSDQDNIISNVLAYADDLVLVSETENDLQRLINIVHKWCNKYRLSVNINKTKVVHYRAEKANCSDFCFEWEGSQIEIVSGYKYLGVFLDEFLKFDTHCEALRNSAGRALGKIISKFSYFRNIGFKTFNKLFESNVESIMSYGVSCLGLKDFGFEKVQSRALRYFLGVHPKTPIPALYGEVGWIPFKYKRLRTYKLYKSELVAEPYVDCLVSRFQRSTFAKFRCGVLPLQIEVGRFRGQKECDRICPICKNGVESEIHFLFECTSYDRNMFLRETGLDQEPNNIERMKKCMNGNQKATVKFITQLWNIRQSLIAN